MISKIVGVPMKSVATLEEANQIIARFAPELASELAPELDANRVPG